MLKSFINACAECIYRHFHQPYLRSKFTIQSKFQITEVATQLRLKEHRSAPSLHPCHYLGAQRLLAQ